MSKSVSVKLNWSNTALDEIDRKTMTGLFRLGYDIAAQARLNAPYLTGALRNTIRVQETGNDSLEVIAGGSYGGKKVPYAWIREQSNKAHPDKAHYMEKAQKLVMSGNYMQKYFGDITR